MTRILVTGGRGFLGRGCVNQLAARGLEVHATTSREPATDPLNVTWHRVDLRNADAAAALVATVRPERILHLAWITQPGSYWSSPDNLRWVEASLSLARAAARGGVTRLVGAGTCAEYDWSHSVSGNGEARLLPHTLYGTAKHALQLLLSRFAAESQMSFAWGRIFFLYGPRDQEERLIPYVVRSILRGEPADCSTGEQIRDFLYIDDASAAFTSLLLSDAEGAFDIGSGEGLPVYDLVGRAAALLGRPDLLRLGARPQSAGEPPILVADIRRVRAELGWTPVVDVSEGMQRTVDWWVAQAGLMSSERN